MTRFGLSLLALALTAAVGVATAQQAPATVADAAQRGDIETVRTLLKQGADVSAAHGDGMTPLHYAADRGDLALVNVLLYAGANVQGVTRLGHYTALHLAARSGNGPVVQALLAKGARVDARTAPGDTTPLHLAAASGSVEAVTALLDKGADVNATEREWDQTPLIFAAASNRTAVVTLLLSRGADVKMASRPVDMQRRSQLDRQATTVQRNVLAASVPRGEEPTPTQQQAAVMAAREVMRTGRVPEPPAAGGGGRGGRGGGGGGPDQGPRGRGAADPQQVGQRGAARGQAAPATATVPAAADPPAATPPAEGTGAPDPAGPPPPITSKGGLTALHHAARQGYVETARALLDAGVEVDRKQADGNTPLLVALINGQFDVAMLLIERGADPNLAADGLAVTPLWAAVNARWQPRTRFPQPQEMELQKASHVDVMEALLTKGADPNARTRQHPWYMLYTGCGSGNCGLTNTTGSTPFWRASYGLDIDAMRLLVKYGADPNIPTMASARGGGGRGGARGGGRGGGGGGRGGGGGQDPDPMDENAAQAQRGASPGDPSGLPPVPGGGPAVFPIHAVAGVEYGEGFAGNAHRHAPEAWLPALKYLVEELGADVNMRDDGGYTPLHHAAARGDNEMILYLVSKGADVKAVSRRGQTTADMANGPVSRISPFPETIALLVKLGAKNNNRCASCVP